MAAEPGAIPPVSGEDSFALFITPSAPRLVHAVVVLARVAKEKGLLDLANAALRMAREIVADLNEISAKFLVQADAMIVDKIEETRSPNRPRSGEGGMDTHIHSKAGPLGTVYVAMLDELDKIVNRRGHWGSFWVAQEFGTNAAGSFLGGDVSIPSQKDRVLLGTFAPSGDAPDAAQRGLGMGHDAAYVPGGAKAGWGTISVDLPARHFLRDGSDKAGERYVAAIAAFQEKYVSRVAELARLLEAEQRRVVSITFKA